MEPRRLGELGRLVGEAGQPEAGRGTDRGSRPGSCGSRARGGATGARLRAGRSAPPGRSRSAGCPHASSASLSRISSVASDFTLTTSSAPSARTSATTISFASAASRAQCTVPPAAWTDDSSSTSTSSSRGERLVLDRRRGSHAGHPSRAPRRRRPRACRGSSSWRAGCSPRTCALASAAVAACGKVSGRRVARPAPLTTRGSRPGAPAARPSPRRRSPPPMCIRHELSQAQTPSAPEATIAASFSSSIALETSAFLTANVPPKPQHSSASGRSTSSTPARRASSRNGASPTRSSRSEWQVGW